jgi:hypothetical protein
MENSMGTFYAMRYSSDRTENSGVGALYLGNGILVGMDSNGGRYHGTYKELNGRIMGSAMLSFPNGGTTVTGLPMKPGWKAPLATNWPADLGNGQPLNIDLMQDQVEVTFEKIGEA